MAPWQPLGEEDPRTCGGFHLANLLGDGGFGRVFLGFRSDIDGPVAVKIFKPEFASSKKWRERFLREIRAIEAMGGMHTAALIDAGSGDDPPWLAMRYVHAPSLDKVIYQYGPFDQLGAWWLATSLGEALAEIHAKGILHRDLKPQNILIERTGVKVIDFGISRFVDGSRVTTDSSFFGTRQFAPNEHLLDPRDATEKSDVFALGMVLAYAMTCRTPFHDRTDSERLMGCPPDLDGVPDELYELVESCLAIQPERRPTAMAVFRAALGHLTDFAVPLASEPGLPLPPEIRDFIDAWTAEPVPAPDLVVATSSSAPSVPGGGGSIPPAEPVRSSRATFDPTWLSKWHDAAKQRRDRYGK
jgi:serine/threonine protein kinase